MTVFELAIIVCLTINSPIDGSYTKTCAWRRPGALYLDETKCKADGEGRRGTVIHGFTRYGDSPGDIVEGYRCDARAVD